jgi:hypothetical protein
MPKCRTPCLWPVCDQKPGLFMLLAESGQDAGTFLASPGFFIITAA